MPGAGVAFSDVEATLSSLIFLFITFMVVRMLLTFNGVIDSSIFMLCLDSYLKATTVAILYCKSSISLTGFKHERPFNA